jgi:predicted dithiol-disulfide oxidoreductase (DUF899 family)
MASPGTKAHGKGHRVATREEWQGAQTKLLEREYEIRGMEEELARERRDLPWVLIEKEYRFDTQGGERTLADLFEGRSQLLVYHMMFGPEWIAGCPACSTVVDHLDGAMAHLNPHDVTMVVCAHAPIEKLNAYKKRMGWRFNLVSSFRSDFNYDFEASSTQEEQDKLPAEVIERLKDDKMIATMAVACGTDVPGYISEAPGLSSFVIEDGALYLASAYREPYGPRFLLGYQQLLERTARGYDDAVMLRRHDEY